MTVVLALAVLLVLTGSMPANVTVAVAVAVPAAVVVSAMVALSVVSPLNSEGKSHSTENEVLVQVPLVGVTTATVPPVKTFVSPIRSSPEPEGAEGAVCAAPSSFVTASPSAIQS